MKKLLILIALCATPLFAQELGSETNKLAKQPSQLILDFLNGRFENPLVKESAITFLKYYETKYPTVSGSLLKLAQQSLRYLTGNISLNNAVFFKGPIDNLGMISGFFRSKASAIEFGDFLKLLAIAIGINYQYLLSNSLKTYEDVDNAALSISTVISDLNSHSDLKNDADVKAIIRALRSIGVSVYGQNFETNLNTELLRNK